MGYESWYLKASHPTEPLGVWIRYTTHQKPGEAERGSLWFTLFADGRVRGSALDAGWDLTFEHPEPELRHLPRGWMYKAPVPRTKLTSPFPAARFSGRVAFGDRTVELDSWPGMVGHNWGAEHAERWIWLHGSSFEGHGEDTWLDAAIGRIRVGPWTTPWIANGVLSLDGRRIQLGGIEKARSTKVDEHPDHCAFSLPGLHGEVKAPRERFVGWVYADPDGSEHNTVNCSIAELTLAVDGQTLHTPNGAAYELGMRETDHGVPIQPFPDG
jgi:hypothetical protein